MARNEEKAQSMLYRFREAQAAELGLGTRSDRRPRMASACKSLRECERWRGEILREISRKVSKIQDAGLTDYEVRDLNDDINKLLREKRHWENQIVALGGANYRRNVAMLDDEGKEVPGTKGYKYFGRAKELPGVKELFQGRKQEQEEEDQMHAFYKKFIGQGPAYYGDLDEKDGSLLKYEQEQEDEGWEEAYSNLRAVLGIPASEPTPPTPGRDKPRSIPSPTPSITKTTKDQKESAKRKASNDPETTGDAEIQIVEADGNKKPKTTSKNGTSQPPPPPPLHLSTSSDPQATSALQLQSATLAASYIPFFTPSDLLPPKLPANEEMEGVLLELKKRKLVEEYFGE